MPTTRAQAAEEEYFRNQEAERRQHDAWDRQRAALDAQVERHRADASRIRREGSGEEQPPASERAVRRGLNRLIVAGWDERLALEEGLGVVSPPGQDRLRLKLARRGVFRKDLGAAVATLGGEPAKRCSWSARGSGWLRAVQRLLIGPHEGDAYAVCSRAAERSAAAYARVLALRLPGDVRFGVERQYAEVALDCQELRRLRWGASALPTNSPDAELGGGPMPASSSPPEPREAPALDT